PVRDRLSPGRLRRPDVGAQTAHPAGRAVHAVRRGVRGLPLPGGVHPRERHPVAGADRPAVVPPAGDAAARAEARVRVETWLLRCPVQARGHDMSTGMGLRGDSIVRYVNAFCPHCHGRDLDRVERLSGYLAVRDGKVWLERGCREHGLVRTLYDEDPEILA